MENIYTTYSSELDITIIFKDISVNENIISTEVVGFYYGEPNEIDTCNYQNNCLKAEF